MTFTEKLLYHHDHPAKVAADVVCLMVAGVLIWQQHLYRAIAVGIGGPLLVSVAILAFANVTARSTTWQAVAFRVAGAFVFWGGAWYKSVLYCTVGILLIAFPWARARMPRVRVK